MKFPQQNINQPETGIGDKKLSVKMCAINDEGAKLLNLNQDHSSSFWSFSVKFFRKNEVLYKMSHVKKFCW